MNPIDAIALGLAAYYGAYVVSRTAGPADVFKRLRDLRVVGPAASCLYCAALYAGVGAYLMLIVFPPALYAIAAAGAASFLYRYTGGDHA